MTKVSATLGGMGSVAISAVPILENVSSTSRKCFDFFLQFVLHLDGRSQACAGNAYRVERHIPFVEAGHKFAAHPRSQQAGEYYNHHGKGDR